MMRNKKRPVWFGVVCRWCLCVSLLAWMVGCGSVPADPLPEGTVIIEHGELFGTLERPAVAFDHVRHVTVLEGAACEDCHAGIAGEEDPFAVIPAGTNGRPAMDAFHDQCLSCHEDKRGAGNDVPPVTCGDCHSRGEEARSVDHVGAGWDYQVHNRHVAGLDQQCEECHHQLDEATGELAYVKGAEEACNACHGSTAVEEVPSLRVASHGQCVLCHLGRQNAKQTAGPTVCKDCHAHRPPLDAAQKAALPRLERGQPDTALIVVEGGRLAPVSFDHRAHENRTDFCQECHHDSMAACGTCHTLEGSADGGWINSQVAFHALQAGQSCVGCHDEVKHGKDCAGCHQLMPAVQPKSSCVICHVSDTPHELQIAVATGGGELDPASAVAAQAPGSLPPATLLGEAPETVTIDLLAADYSPVEYPHQQVVEKLQQISDSSELAKRFHGSGETLCYGCHHNSPAGQKPPSCSSCHEPEHFDNHDAGRPGLKAAYHLQCLDCHRSMEIEPQACGTGCHTPVARPEAEVGR